MRMRTDNYLTIESVQVERTAGDGHIYGEIMVEFHQPQSVYRRSIGNAEAKLAGDFLTLTGSPFRRLTDWCTIFVSLYDGDDRHDIAVGDIHCNLVRENSSLYHRSPRRTLHGQYGAVSMRYNVLYDAEGAAIEVAVLGGEEDAAARVFGGVRVCQYLGEDDGFTSVILFGKSAGESVSVGSGGVIPLDRCVVAVHSKTYVTVELELSCAGDDIRGGDELIALGAVDLDEEDIREHAFEEIEGSRGRRVQVSIRPCDMDACSVFR